ncbi:hypothetical protein LT679_12050 [Mucilaginibacter roseus]|uniref:Uncharacterized protein n=1 Tax=Mucilaginibacter roseus TaxID=1528868 RepID=A0ABS8U706_9SPHI|nr:hypothetical protein [Mucilaginibacter roseus]MCD8741338.1 hypothetical protein [Mucilaginibacter roseus]
MITVFDDAYIQTKKVKQGASHMNPEMVPLADWMLKKYGVAPLNIIYTNTLNAGERTRTIEIIFEYCEQQKLFLENQFVLKGAIKKKILKFFKWNIDVRSENKLLNWLLKPLPYFKNEPLVTSSSFMPLAIEEANSNISDEDIQLLKKQIAEIEIWRIVRNSTHAIFFFYTESNLKEFDNSAFKEKLSLKYFPLIKKYDEYNYITVYSISICLDSKENFDKKYGSNWFYYLR